ncbi:bifunctional DNA primase/polymerase [Tessaracoccus sp. Y1736]
MTAATLSSESPVMVAALGLHAEGRVPLPVAPGSKRPAQSGWRQTTYLDAADVQKMFSSMVDGSGVGLRLGDGLADVDLDKPMARRAAPMLLSPTGLKHGRKSSADSHWWFRLTDCKELPYLKFTGPDGSTVVELRADSGHQTVIPPSIHPSGEPLEWSGAASEKVVGDWDAAAAVSGVELRSRVSAIALVSILAEAWPGPGARHDAYLALAGALLRCNHDSAELVQLAEKVIRALAIVTNDADGADARVVESVPTTVMRLSRDEAVTGWTALAALLTDPNPNGVVECAKRAADAIRDALGLAVPGGEMERPASSWWPVDVSSVVKALVAGGDPRPVPTVGLLQGVEAALFYRGRVNGVAGESGAGKTWTVLVAAAQEFALGNSVVYIDLEDSLVGIVGRFLEMGVPPYLISRHLAYVSPQERLGETARAALWATLDAVRPSLVVIDSTGEGLSLEGANPNADDEVARWFRMLARRVAAHQSEPAVVVLDHVPKSDDGGGLWPIGSQRKRAAIDGAQYMQKTVRPFSRGVPGFAKLLCAKDRGGNYRLSQTVAELHVDPVMDLRADDADTAAEAAGASLHVVNLTLLPVGDAGGPTPFRPTLLMERVSRYVQDHPGDADRTARQIRANVSGKERAVIAAANLLVAEGYMRASLGVRGSTVYTSVRPFTEATDPGAPVT